MATLLFRRNRSSDDGANQEAIAYYAPSVYFNELAEDETGSQRPSPSYPILMMPAGKGNEAHGTKAEPYDFSGGSEMG